MINKFDHKTDYLFFYIDCYTNFIEYDNKKNQRGWRISLKVNIENIDNKAFISAYDSNYVVINNKKYQNIILTDNMVVHEITETSNIFDKSILDKLW